MHVVGGVSLRHMIGFPSIVFVIHTSSELIPVVFVKVDLIV